MQNNASTDRKLGIALVGLGHYSEEQLAPALQETKLCKLAGLVSGNMAKAKIWAKKYDIPQNNIYLYDHFDEIAYNPMIDIVYVVLPNALHAEFTIRAAKAGKHVICEKPMATTVEDCERMINACRDANVQLSIGYRLHFEPHHLEMIRLSQQEVFGKVKKIKACYCFEVGNSRQWRLDKELAGGGALVDIGIYAIQAARYLSGEDPIYLRAGELKVDIEKFNEVEETLFWRMEFPGNVIAECCASYSEQYDRLRVEATNGWFELSPAYSYKGIKGSTTNGPMNFPEVNQQALQMDDFADSILSKRPNRVPGEEGLRDVRIIQAVYESLLSHEKVLVRHTPASNERTFQNARNL